MKKDFMNSMKEKTASLRPSVLSTEENIKGQLRVLDNLRELIPPLKSDEYEQLQQNILKHGVKDPLMVWETTSAIAQVAEGDDPVFVLIDGHNRYQICQQYNLDYRINLIRFPTIDEVRDYMIDHQLGRRNLTPEQASYLRGLRYLQQKSIRGGNKQAERAHIDVSASLGKEYGVSSRTIKRDGEFAAGLDKLTPDLKHEILTGRKKLPKSSIKAVAKATPVEPIDNLDDLINVAENLSSATENKTQTVVEKRKVDALETTIRKLASGNLTLEKCEALIRKTNDLIALIRPK